MMNIALLVVDMQKAFFAGSSKSSMKDAADYINAALDLFRRNNRKIIWIQDEDEEDGNTEGTEGFEIIDLLEVRPDEKRITKHYGNAFNKTELPELLAAEKIETVLITGYCAEHCVLSTYRGALDHDLTPVLLKHGIASGNKKNLRFVENCSETIGLTMLEKIIN